MRFGRLPVLEAEGGLLAHQVRAGERVFRKSHRLSREDCAALAAAGVPEVVVAQLDATDVGEDEAASRLAAAAAGEGVRVDPAFTGRANLFAETAGVLLPDRAAIDRFNAIDPGMTFATLPAFKRVEPGEMVGTVKIIPFSVPATALDAGVTGLGPAALRIAPFREKRVAMISLRLPSLKETVIDKTVKVTEARLAALGSRLVGEQRLAHRQDALEAALRRLDPAGFDLLLVFGAAAIADRRDAIPAALEACGGRVIHFGMPVDPGNLLLIGEFAGKPAIGAPGCARSPRENGFDWVLARLCADLPVTAADIQGMGVGGLLMEIVSRPQPRAAPRAPAPEIAGAIAGIVLAAGRSTRFGTDNKLLAPFEGRSMLAHVLDAGLAARLDPLVVVTGHEAAAVRAEAARVGGEGVSFAENPAYADGLSTSLRAGLAALPGSTGAAFILLGDMPRVGPAVLRRLIQAAAEQPGAEAFVPTFAGHWGNPVLVRRSLFASLSRLHGDQGARKLLEASRDVVAEVPIEDAAVLADFDTRAMLDAAHGPNPPSAA